MDKKAHSKPMKAIVDRLETYGEFEVTYFGDDTIMNKPIAEWPACDCLLSWHSDGFPLAKVSSSTLPHQPQLSQREHYGMPCIMLIDEGVNWSTCPPCAAAMAEQLPVLGKL